MNPLKTPSASLGGKKSLLKSMVKNIRPSKLSVKKASLKSVLGGKKSNSGMAGLGAPSLTGGSPFPLNAGLGATQSPLMSPGSITGGNGANLGTNGVF
jgi:hypothetical protein